eukprot:c21720_g1_i1 orf=410-2845(-)
MAIPALHLLALSRRLQRMNRRLPSRTLHFTEPWYSRGKVFGKREISRCYSASIQHGGICSKMFSPYNKSLVQRIHTQQSDFERPHTNFGSLQTFMKFYNFRPLLVIFRAANIMAEVTMLSVWHLLLRDIHKRAEKLRRCLIRLGPFYIKLGQALSTRPDILPNAYCQELAKLQDHVPPFRSSIALKAIESELGYPAKKLFAKISREPVAAASLGQVYKASLISGEPVAVKVQRPGMQARLALDSHLLHIVGGPLQRYLGARGDIVDAVNEMVQHMFDEIDYVKEGQNAERFGILYGGLSREHEGPINSDKKSCSSKQRWGSKTKLNIEASDLVKVPKIYWNLSSKRVLTMEWIDGIKLTDLEKLHEMKFDIQELVDQGVFSSLRQLLEEGFFHADPHPGNLVVTKEGMLAYFDFGMMGDFPREYRIGLIRTLVHFVNRDSVGLANDFSGLGFVPKGANLEGIAGALRASFGDETSRTQLDFQGIMSQLSNVMYKYNFRLPPQYALVIRALGSLEGTATLLDPDFKVVASAYPFIIGRLLADPDPDMRKILRELLIRNNGSIRWHRLERLVIAIGEHSSKSGPSKQPEKGRVQSEQDGLEKSATRSWGTFDTRTVVSATSDLFEFILSEDGYRVRVLLVQDIVRWFNTFLDEALWTCIYPRDSSKHSEPSRVRGLGQMGKHLVDGDSMPSQRSSGDEKMKSSSVSHEIKRPRKYSSINGSSDDGPQTSPGSTEEVGGLGSRFSSAFSAFNRAVNSAPELWIVMLCSFATRSEAQVLMGTIVYSLLGSCYNRGSESIWLLLSRLLHEIYDTRC